jgi:hypothetical protein
MTWLIAITLVWGLVGWAMAVVIAWQYDHREDR